MTTTATSTKAAPGSTSTPERTTRPITVRAKDQILTAVKAIVQHRVHLPGKILQIVQPGDWLIYQGELVVDIVRVLTSDYEIVEPGLLIPETRKAEIERVLGIGAMQSADALIKAADRLVRLEIGGILVDFTPGQWEELKRKAAVQSQSVEEYLQRMVKKFTQDLWGL